MKYFVLICFCGLFSRAWAQQLSELELLPSPPDYLQLDDWVAHPETDDAADLVPGKNELKDQQAEAAIDVFFVYPTIYSDDKYPNHPWFADVNDPKLNREIAESTIKYQASVFNGSARIYAPLYRQAHLDVFRVGGEFEDSALSMAYIDVKRSFEVYLERFNQGRPIIIASHSQGTVHAGRLLSEFFDGTELQERLVAAYIVGMPVKKDQFDEIQPCSSASETGCWITWNTYRQGYFPDHFAKLYENALTTNPLNWKIDNTYASRDENKGGILRNYRRIIPRLTDAKNHRGILWVEKPHFFWRFLLRTRRYHIADYNLFYLNIRENVAARVAAYLNLHDPKTSNVLR